MSISYLSGGRTRQKGRTHAAMLAAARELLAEGVTPTVEQAADRAGVSRTTAYRYFTNQRELLVATYPKLDSPSLLDADAPTDPIARLDLVTAQIGRQLVEFEHELRANLRLALESPTKPERESLPLRQGRVIPWLEDALSPLTKSAPKSTSPSDSMSKSSKSKSKSSTSVSKASGAKASMPMPAWKPISKAELRRLVLSIRAAIGIEPLIWLCDIGGLSREDAVELMRDSARTLLRAAMTS